jgi:hypothetical protein
MEDEKKETKENKVNVKTIQDRELFGKVVLPVGLSFLLFLFLLFEQQVVDWFKEGAISMPINYVALFLGLGLLFLIKGSIITLRPSKKTGEKRNNNLVASSWMIQGFVLSMVALFYGVMDWTHVALVGFRLSWLVVLFVIWEVLTIKSIIKTFKGLKLFD